MAEDPRNGGTDETEAKGSEGQRDDEDEGILLALASALLPIFFRRRRD